MAGRKRAKDALRDSETRYRRLFETAKDGILLLDAVSGQITDVNPFLIELLGYNREELLGKKLGKSAHSKMRSQPGRFSGIAAEKIYSLRRVTPRTRHGERVEVEFVSNLYEVTARK